MIFLDCNHCERIICVAFAASGSNTINVAYMIPLTASLPSVLIGTAPSIQLPQVTIDPSFTRTAFITYNWTIISVLPSSSSTPSLNSTSAASPTLSGLSNGTSTTLGLVVTDIGVNPPTAGSQLSFVMIVNMPAFTEPVHVVGLSPSLLQGPLAGYALVPTQTCVAGRSCTLQCAIGGVALPDPSANTTVSFFTSRSDASGHQSAIPIGVASVPSRTTSPFTFAWPIPTNSYAGDIVIRAVAAFTNPATGSIVTVMNDSSPVRVTSSAFVWAATAWSICSATCGQVGSVCHRMRAVVIIAFVSMCASHDVVFHLWATLNVCAGLCHSGRFISHCGLCEFIHWRHRRIVTLFRTCSNVKSNLCSAVMPGG